MNKFLEKRYALLGKTAEKSSDFTVNLRNFFKNPVNHYILFLFIAWIVGDLAISKILPYSFQSAFAITFAYSIASVGFCLLMGYSRTSLRPDATACSW